MELDGVPKFVSRKQAIRLLDSLGIDGSELLRLELTPAVIKLSIYARNENGSILIDDGEVAKHHLVIPIID